MIFVGDINYKGDSLQIYYRAITRDQGPTEKSVAPLFTYITGDILKTICNLKQAFKGSELQSDTGV